MQFALGAGRCKSPLHSRVKKSKPHYYQQQDIDSLFSKLKADNTRQKRLLYQLPTGGGKTMVFSEIARRYIEQYQRKVIVLTHRTELCRQTTQALKNAGVINKVIDSQVKTVRRKDVFKCYVAMVETLKNRIKDGLIPTSDVGLVIVDEAHHNSFHKLLGKFENASVIGVTATPLSADVNLPMNKFYEELLVGEPIASLIEQGFLASPKVYAYDVELNTLKPGLNGDFTQSSSDQLYSSEGMLDLLMKAYRAHSLNKKTLIFNNGIVASRIVFESFHAAGYPIRHLDNKASATERQEILNWYKKTRGAILTSISILTTGFDEPSIQSVILNRATTSLTLYHQMVGRGSRTYRNKKTFQIIDLGNNVERFGDWHAPTDWNEIFANPQNYHDQISKSTTEIHYISPELKSKFPNTLEVSFDVFAAYQHALATNQKTKNVIRDSIRQHAAMCVDNSDSVVAALALSTELDKEIDYRVKQYAKCLGNVTANYTRWLKEDYKTRLKSMIQKVLVRRNMLKEAM
ncbi:DEAD/DEAH box helicase [Pedobacter sp. SYP-B3415]|uniref:DEAD/DEAH box helicase n=1 Tax=Pedobacter sp. SYP-B3415 TaxID=2496641 RepID=UPI00101D77EA|nr:DEAD/DEAH box helicase [Pedobacter sp. SYP-B3415]